MAALFVRSGTCCVLQCVVVNSGASRDSCPTWRSSNKRHANAIFAQRLTRILKVQAYNAQKPAEVHHGKHDDVPEGGGVGRGFTMILENAIRDWLPAPEHASGML